MGRSEGAGNGEGTVEGRGHRRLVRDRLCGDSLRQPACGLRGAPGDGTVDGERAGEPRAGEAGDVRPRRQAAAAGRETHRAGAGPGGGARTWHQTPGTSGTVRTSGT